MSARIFVHPRCHEGPAVGALDTTLVAAGINTDGLGVGPADHRGRRELVRTIGPNPQGGVVLERMDGSRYTHRTGWPAPVYA